MNFHLARHRFRFLFNVLAMAFTIGYSISIVSYSAASLSRETAKPLVHELGQASYLGFESGQQNFSKIPFQSLCQISFQPDVVQTHLRNYQNLFISLFERNVFYVYITIHAP
jgi:hypothetical protein